MVASKGSWKWTQECSAVEGTKPLTNHVYVKQEPPQQTVNEDRRAQKRARTEMFTEAPSEPTSDPPTESSASWNWLKRGKNEQMFKDMTKKSWIVVGCMDFVSCDLVILNNDLDITIVIRIAE
ncbi:hypothetical protein YC2023_024337 [Brassica napus]